MKMIKLTNATRGRVGEGLILNTEAMMSFFENTQDDGTKITVAFGMNGSSWEVKETIDELMDKIKEIA
jgi:uncharacterized protein YlzI (FlbEa/FlbD family)